MESDISLDMHLVQEEKDLGGNVKIGTLFAPGEVRQLGRVRNSTLENQRRNWIDGWHRLWMIVVRKKR